MPRRSQTKKSGSKGRSNSEQDQDQQRSDDTGRRGRSSSTLARNIDREQQNRGNDNTASASAHSAAAAPAGLPMAGNQNVAAHVRERQRAVAEREAARLALPERRAKKVLAHSSKAARTSTPFGTLSRQHRDAVFADDAEWCGPFSVARQMIAAREEAKRKRLEEEEAEDDAADGSQRMHHPLDAIMKEMEHEQKKKSHPSMQWKSSVMENSTPSNMYAKRQKLTNAFRETKSIPTLAQLCVSFVVDNFDFVESLGDVDNDVRLAISKELVGRNKLDDKAFQALVSVVGCGNDDTTHDPTLPPPLPQPVSSPVIPSTLETLEIVDCAGISHDCMAQTLEAVGGSLRYLLLTNAGRCFGMKSVKALMKEIKDASGEIHYTPRAQLQCISISGAYLLKDEDAARLVTANAGTLQSIAFDTCPLLGPSFVRSIQGLHKHQVPTEGSNNNSNNKLLELALSNMTQFTTEDLQLLTEKSSTSLKSVRSLTLQNLAGLSDDMVSSILAAVGLTLDTALNLSHSHELTDATLSAIRQFNPRVKTLVLDGLKELTAAGLEALFTPLADMSPPPKLKVLKLASIHHEAVNDDVMKLVLATRVTDEDDNDLASVKRSHHTSGIVQLDVSGSRLLTDSFLEALAETSAETLEEINVSYCPLLSDQGLGYLVSKVRPQLHKVVVWGNAQLTEIFFDGHDRVDEGKLGIVGAWMKKSGTSSLR